MIRRHLPVLITLAVFIAGYLICLAQFPSFASTRVIGNLLTDNAFLGIVAVGMTFVILSGGIDLSVGSVIALSSVVAAILSPQGLMVALPAGVATGLLVGAVNAGLIVGLRLPPFMATLATMLAARGASLVVSDNRAVSVDWASDFTALGMNKIGPLVPWTIVIAALVVVVAWYILERTSLGRTVLAVGGNAEAAHLMGLKTSRALVFVYLFSGACAGLAGVLYTAQFSAGAAQAGEPLLLDSVAAVVIGGASLFGGSGTILGTVAGAFVIAVIQYGLVFVDVKPFWQFISVGVVIIISVLIDQAQRAFAGGRQNE